MEDQDIRQQKLDNQRTLLMKKQQKKRADSQMVTANRDTRQKNRKHKVARSDETPLLISQSLSNTSLSDQVEHAHDNPLDEITLGECDMTASMTLEEMPSEKPVTPKKMNLEIDKEPEVKCDVENDAQQLTDFSEVEESEEKEKEKDKDKEKKEKKTKKKDKVKESEDTRKTNKTTKKERKKTHFQDASTQEIESVVEVASPKKNKRDESDDEEEDGSKRPVPQSPKWKKQLDTSRCQISDESKDEEVQEKEKKEKKTKKGEKTNSSEPF
ncbi:histone-lysine N-methyltransferase, H3 lysine-79 specific-like [Xiphias gladius]|uniref:histone-lysine N-methyltransferase, H3 lysine-79 specific-like n=1 Tax=Xiphias gladius TaxID=8245 RepID=UPI001A9822E3|nr:histone-lysine N-methyltransferase, H3 lysine-79 specific-like [Xiphias gladius]